MFVLVLHFATLPEQWLSPVHWTHAVPPEQCLLDVAQLLEQPPQWASVLRSSQVVPPQVSWPVGQPVAHDVVSAQAYGLHDRLAGVGVPQ